MKLNTSSALLGAVTLCSMNTVSGFYLPGVVPKNYVDGEVVQLKVNKLTSYKTHLPYEYYRLPFCTPKTIVNAAENLGEILMGDVIENSAYDIKFDQHERCKVLCRKQYTAEQSKAFIDKIVEEYAVNWVVDNLPPAANVAVDAESTLPVYNGFPLGGIVRDPENGPDRHALNNHVAITIKTHHPAGEAEGSRIVGFEVEPYSVKHTYEGEWNDENPPALTTCAGAGIKHDFQDNYLQFIDKEEEVIWTYDVAFERSEIRWPSRWDIYLSRENAFDDEVHWFSIINSLLIVVFLTGMVAMILMRTLHRDLTRYNRVPTEEEKAEDREETGWKLVHGDVFRPPTQPMLFAVTVGTGAQVLAMSFITLIFAAIGFLSPANRGSLMIALLLLFALMGATAGYQSSRTYKMFNGANWQSCTLATAFLYPGITFAIIFMLNLVTWAEDSSAAIPFGSMLAVLMLWFGISVPLTFLGAYFGYKKDVDKQPVATQDIPRQIPEQPWYMHPVLTILVGGILPFGAVFVELFFILSSLWMNQYYYVFGFLLLVFLILVATCAEITIVLCYFQLCGEDYRWWWRSLLTSGASAVYLFLYSLFYFSSKLKMDMFAALVLYFGYMFILSLLFFLATGVIGYLACLWFVYKIYAAVKVD